jgi:DNA polymerase-1
MLIDWAETKKTKSTYVDGLLTKLHKGSLHPSFHLHRTATGRLSSSNPNLQNIPRDSRVRSLFVAAPDNVLLVADYDQIELRVMCMFSGDEKMSEFFLTGEDIHAGAAALVLNKPVTEVTPEERQLGKGVNFLTAYGGGPQKLSRTTGIDEEHARYVIDQYYKQFSGITTWKREVIQDGIQQGYVTTLSGRRRRLPDLRSSDKTLRSRAERQAVNAVVQGSAADICKKAMISAHSTLKVYRAKLLVQVHDELVVMLPEEFSEEGTKLLIESMGDGTSINGIPLKVSCHSAYNWSEAKGK